MLLNGEAAGAYYHLLPLSQDFTACFQRKSRYVASVRTTPTSTIYARKRWGFLQF